MSRVAELNLMSFTHCCFHLYGHVYAIKYVIFDKNSSSRHLSNLQLNSEEIKTGFAQDSMRVHF